jgi:hypothetical protein
VSYNQNTGWRKSFLPAQKLSLTWEIISELLRNYPAVHLEALVPETTII